MGRRQVNILESVRTSIAKASWFIESKGLISTADRFAEDAYDFIERLSNPNISFKLCLEPERALHGFKCVQFRKYTIVYEESDNEILVVEFIPSKMITW